MVKSSGLVVAATEEESIIKEILVRAEARKRKTARRHDPELGDTPEEAEARLEEMRGDINKFGEYVFGFVPTHFHRYWNKVADDVINRRVPQNKLLIIAPPNSAKALALDTPIPTPTGWTTMGELNVGDKLFGADGRIISVVRKSPVFVNRPVYNVVTHCGETIVADEDHLWSARLDRKSPYTLVTTDILARPRNKAAQIRRAPSLQLPDADLPIPPYVLGLWLGDGASASASISAHDKDFPHYENRLRQDGFEVTRGKTPQRFNITGLIKLLRQNNLLNNKHIPEVYLRASTAQRLALLQGLIDTDGSVSATTNTTTFSNTNKTLAYQTCELIRSLGVRARVSESPAMLYGKDCGPVYRITFALKDSASLPRKRWRTLDGIKTPNISVKALPAGRASTVCITVDAPDGMFLAGRSFTPTHNSTWNSVIRSPHYLGNHPDHHLLFMTASDPMAGTFGNTIRDILESNEKYRYVYPDKVNRPNKRRGWSGDGLYLHGTPVGAKDPAFKAVGLNANIMGARANGVILDDPMDQKSAQSEAEQKKAKNYIDQTVIPRIQPGVGWLVACMTRYAEADLASHFIDLSEKSGDWIYIRTPLIAEEDDPLGRAVGELLWPERFDENHVRTERARLTLAEFNMVHQGDVTGMGGDIFKDEAHFQDIPPDFWSTIYPRCIKLMLWDLAFSNSKRACFTVCMTVAVDTDLNMYIINVFRERLTTVGVENMMVKMIRLVRPFYVGVETENFHGTTIQSIARNVHTRAMAVIDLVKPEKDKVSRARLPAGRAELGKVFVVKKAKWYDTFMREVLGFPNTRFKDQVDTLSLAASTVEKLAAEIDRMKAVGEVATAM